MTNRLLLLMLFVIIGCSNPTKVNSRFESLKKMIPTVKGNQTFSFAELSNNVWDWQKSQKFIEVDSALWSDNFNMPKPLNSYSYNYQSNYYFKILDFKDDFFNVITLQHIHNNNESYMYLFQFDKYGNRKKVFILASIFKSPEDYEEIHSIIQGNKIISYKHYSDGIIIKNDTTINLL